MPLVELRTSPSSREVCDFARFWLPAVCLGLAFWATFRADSMLAILLTTVGLASLLLGFTRPGWLRPLYIGWMTVTFPLSWIIAHLLVVIIYFVVITPIGMVMRFTGHDPLARQFDREAQSYWIPRRHDSDRRRYLRQF